MRFDLVDRVLELSDSGAVTIKLVTQGEEYLQDHFPTFPVLPGVLMLETMVQAARLVADRRGGETPMVLGEVRALKYNRFVAPGSSIRAEVDLESEEDGSLSFKGRVVVESVGVPGEGETAASGRFTMREVRLGPPEPAEVGRDREGA